MHKLCSYCEAEYEFEEAFDFLLAIDQDGWTQAILVCPSCAEEHEILDIMDW